MAEAETTDTAAIADPLLCGTPLGDLVAQVADDLPSPDPEHQASCPYCGAALDRTRAWWAAVEEMADEPLAPPPGVQARVRSWFRNLASAQWAEILQAEPGRTLVSTAVLAGVARAAATTVGEVAQVRRVGAEVAGPLVTVEVDVVARFGAQLRNLAGRIRRAVIADVRTVTGSPVTSVDVHFVDLSPAEG